MAYNTLTKKKESIHSERYIFKKTKGYTSEGDISLVKEKKRKIHHFATNDIINHFINFMNNAKIRTETRKMYSYLEFQYSYCIN